MTCKSILGVVAGLSISSAAAAQVIASSGDLTAGSFGQGVTQGRAAIASAPNWAFFTFSAVAGDTLDIEANRLDGDLDPASSVVSGNAIGLAIASLTGRNFIDWSGPGLSPVLAVGDDEDPPAFPGPFGDPHYQLVAPTTGLYTVVVCSASSNSPTTEFRFEIAVRGSTFGGACCLPDGSCSTQPNSGSCESINGVYRGDLTACASAGCPCTVLTNGGFESGTFSGWTQFGNQDLTGVADFAALSGLNGAFFGNAGDTGGIQQTVPAPAGAPLEISLSYTSAGTPQLFQADLGNVNLITLVNDSAHGFPTRFTFSIPAPTENPVLRFTCRNDPGFIFLDDVRVCVGTPPACYANCDNSTATPILNANDFQCFLNRFAASDPAANCDGSTATPILNANDFQCFLNKFASGCS